MASREIGKFAVGIYLSEGDNGKLNTKFSTTNINMPKETIISQLRLFIRMLEEDLYPDFKNNITSINLDPDE